MTADHLGSTRVVTDSSGTEVKRYDYLPYGEEILARGSNYGSRFSYSHPFTISLAIWPRTARTRSSPRKNGIPSPGSITSSPGTTPAPREGSRARILLFGSIGKKINNSQFIEYIGNPQAFNKYAYVKNSPLVRIDPQGLWDKKAHDALVFHALNGRASASDIKAIQNSSADFDRRTQGAGQEYLHSMRSPNQSVEDSINKRNDFVEEKLRNARGIAREGSREEALKALGEAIHPLMDLTSPLHAFSDSEPIVWTNTSIEWLDHGFNESPSEITARDYELEDQAIQDAYNYVFDQMPENNQNNQSNTNNSEQQRR